MQNFSLHFAVFLIIEMLDKYKKQWYNYIRNFP